MDVPTNAELNNTVFSSGDSADRSVTSGGSKEILLKIDSKSTAADRLPLTEVFEEENFDQVVPYEQQSPGGASKSSEIDGAMAFEDVATPLPNLEPETPRKLRGSKGGPPVELAVSMKWKSVTALRIVDQTFNAEVDITFETPDHPGIDPIDPEFFEKGPNLCFSNSELERMFANF